MDHCYDMSWGGLSTEEALGALCVAITLQRPGVASMATEAVLEAAGGGEEGGGLGPC